MSFPAEVFAALTPAPYLLAHLTPSSSGAVPSRANGRKSSQVRSPSINTNSLTHCSGSALVRLGDTTAVCGVRAEILLTQDVPKMPQVDSLRDEAMTGEDSEEEGSDVDEMASLNLLVPNIEMNTGSSSAYIPGNAPSSLAQSLSQRLLNLLHTTNLVRANDLRILYHPPRSQEDDTSEDAPMTQIKAYWVLYIDVLFISLDGNPFDSAWCAILAALENTKLPKAWWDADVESILCSDRLDEARNLSLRGLPVTTTFAIFEPGKEKGVKENRSWLLADPDTFEEQVCDECVTAVIDVSDGNTRIRRIEKAGGGIVGKELMREVVNIAVLRWGEWNGVLRG